MLNKFLNNLFSRPKREPRSAEYKAGFAHGMTVGAMIERSASPPEVMLPFRDSPADWCDGYSAGLQAATRRPNRPTFRGVAE